MGDRGACAQPEPWGSYCCAPGELRKDVISRRDFFEHFLTDGRVELDSNIVERAIRHKRQAGGRIEQDAESMLVPAIVGMPSEKPVNPRRTQSRLQAAFFDVALQVRKVSISARPLRGMVIARQF